MQLCIYTFIRQALFQKGSWYQCLTFSLIVNVTIRVRENPITIEPGQLHLIIGLTDAVLLEVSTTHSDEDVKREMEDQAINEMQHLGWFAEEMVDKKGSPKIEHTDVDKSTETADMLRADIKIEKEVAAEYGRAAKEIEEPDLKDLLIRIRDHEEYHADVFDDLLKEEEKRG